MRHASVAAAFMLARASFADTSVSNVTVNIDERTGEPHYAGLTLHATAEQGSRLGGAWLNCGSGGETVLSISFDVFGSRPAELQESFSLETVRIQVDRKPEHSVHVEVLDYPSPAHDPPRSKTLTLPLLPQDARGLVDEMAEGRGMIAEMSNVQPALRFDLATARPDIAVFLNTCDQIRVNFEQSPYRWARADTAVDPATGILLLRVYHDANDPGNPEDVYRTPYVMVQCRNDQSRHGVDVVALVPEKFHPRAVRVGDTQFISLQVDAGPVRQIALTAEDSEPDGVVWTTTRLPPEERPSMALLEVLRTGNVMNLHGFGARSLRFDLAGGRQPIAEFADLCTNLPKFERHADVPGQALRAPDGADGVFHAGSRVDQIIQLHALVHNLDMERECRKRPTRIAAIRYTANPLRGAPAVARAHLA